MIVTDANLLWKRNARAKTANWRSILRTNKSGTILLGKETMEARGKSMETLNATENINFFFPGISTTNVDWETMVDELLEPKALHLTRSLKRNLLITMGMDLTFTNKTKKS